MMRDSDNQSIREFIQAFIYREFDGAGLVFSGVILVATFMLAVAAWAYIWEAPPVLPQLTAMEQCLKMIDSHMTNGRAIIDDLERCQLFQMTLVELPAVDVEPTPSEPTPSK